MLRRLPKKGEVTGEGKHGTGEDFGIPRQRCGSRPKPVPGEKKKTPDGGQTPFVRRGRRKSIRQSEEGKIHQFEFGKIRKGGGSRGVRAKLLQ